MDRGVEYRRKRRPFKSEVRLLRRPGEFLFGEIEKVTDDYVVNLFGFICITSALFAALAMLNRIVPSALWVQATVACAVTVAFSVFAALGFKKLCKLKVIRDRMYLGYFGESAVAEYLDELKQQGCYVFHDVQCEDGGSKFNIDHVVVGPTGLFAVETKTYSKYWPAEDKLREEIEFVDGQLRFTWGTGAKHIRQAIRQADWLANRFGQKYPVQAILTFPGWEVVEREIGHVWILYPGGLATAVRKRGTSTTRNLNSKEIEDIRDYLEKACRDVEY